MVNRAGFSGGLSLIWGPIRILLIATVVHGIRIPFAGMLTLILLGLTIWPSHGHGGNLRPRPQVQQVSGTVSIPSNDKISLHLDSGLQIPGLTDILQKFLFSGAYQEDASAGQIRLIFHLFTNPAPPSPLSPLPTTAADFPKMGNAGYVLVIDQTTFKRITVVARTSEGLFNGGMTTLQLLLKDSTALSESLQVREDNLQLQVIQDYPDHSLRGASWLELRLAARCSAGGACISRTVNPSPSPPSGCSSALNWTYCLSDSARRRLDLMARNKINLCEYKDPTISLNDSSWTTRSAKTAVQELTSYANKYFMKVIFEVDPLVTQAPEYMDGWWNKDQSFVFAPTQASGFLYNGSFEDDDADGELLRDGWGINTPTATSTSRWGVDNAAFYDGHSSMRLHQETADGYRATLGQALAIPSAAAGDTFGLRGWYLKTNVTGGNLQVTIYAADSLGRVVGGSTNIKSLNIVTASSTDWTYGETLSPVYVDRTRAKVLNVYSRILTGSGDSWIDRLQLLRMTQQAGVWKFVEPAVEEDLVPAEFELFTDRNFEGQTDADGFPIPWGSPGSWSYPNSVLKRRWKRDSIQPHSGLYSMRLVVPQGTPQQDSTNRFALGQVINGPIAPGLYRLSGWARTNWKTNVNFFPQFVVYTSTANGSNADSAAVVIDGNAFGKTGWTPYHVDLNVPTERSKITGYSRLLYPGADTLWVDDVSLRKLLTYPTLRPMSDLLFNSTMETTSSGAAVGWGAPVPGFGGVTDGTSSWTTVSKQVDPTGVFSGDYALKLTIPTGHTANSVLISQAIPSTFLPNPPVSSGQKVPAGRYLATGWAKIVNATKPGQLTLVAIRYDASNPDPSKRRIFTDIRSAVTSTGSSVNWQRLRLVGDVPANNDTLFVYARIFEGSGTMYLDDVALRKIDGDVRALMPRVYAPVMTSSTGTPFTLNTDYALRRMGATEPLDTMQPPARIVKTPTTSIQETTRIRLSYDQFLFWNSTNPYESGLNLSDTTTASKVLTQVVGPVIDRALADAFGTGTARAVLFSASEIRGFNRSGLGRLSNGNLKNSNAVVLAKSVNRYAQRARAIDPTVTVYTSSDLWSDRHNGGIAGYQVQYGGVSGKTSEAISTTSSNLWLDRAARIVSWWYEPEWFAHVTRSNKTFQRKTYSVLQATWYDSTNVSQAAAVSLDSTKSLGGIATTWHDTPVGVSVPIDDVGWIRECSDRFWNTPWRQIYFADFNPLFASSGVIPTGAASITSDSLLAAPPLYPPGRNLGALRLDSSSATITLPDLTMENGSSYWLTLYARGALTPYTLTKTIRVKPRWVRPDDSSFDGADSVRTIGGPGPSGSADLFNRYFIGLNRPSSTSSPDRLRLIINVDAIGEGSPTVSVDNFAIWETLPQCVKADLDVAVAPSDTSLTVSPGTYTVSVRMTNNGCRDIRVTGGTTVPSGMLITNAPVVVPPNTTRLISGQGSIGFEEAQVYQWRINYKLNGGSQQTKTVSISVATL